MNLYSLDEDIDQMNNANLKLSKGANLLAKRQTGEPRTFYKLRFNLNKAFSTTKFTLDDLTWQCMDSTIVFNRDKTKVVSNKLSGSILYEDFDTNELKLNFYNATVETARTSLTERKYECPQAPLGQSWIVEYPLLAYKSCTPDN